jgi:hypothetical protein
VYLRRAQALEIRVWGMVLSLGHSAQLTVEFVHFLFGH